MSGSWRWRKKVGGVASVVYMVLPPPREGAKDAKKLPVWGARSLRLQAVREGNIKVIFRCIDRPGEQEGTRGCHMQIGERGHGWKPSRQGS